MPLAPDHDTTRFTCGKPPLDSWLKERAIRAEARSARTYVSCVGERVVGYYCFAAGSVQLEQVPRRLRRNMPTHVPVILIGRLAVDREFQGIGLGSALLRDALLRATQASRIIGVRAVMVHALDEDAAIFYERVGFTPFPEAALTYFLPIEAIEGSL